jgi:hypothetical protein
MLAATKQGAKDIRYIPSFSSSRYLNRMPSKHEMFKALMKGFSG